LADEVTWLVVGILIGILGGIPLGFIIASFLPSYGGMRIKSSYGGKEIITDLLPSF
jgi:hypothetical protein